ncbi:hypothetical protein I317_04813 [Kwoniella heveanensis CBS 569]|nr:hypothetical protein I317_04813 [Kwoniella heveanensis CBS 569]
MSPGHRSIDAKGPSPCQSCHQAHGQALTHPTQHRYSFTNPEQGYGVTAHVIPDSEFGASSNINTIRPACLSSRSADTDKSSELLLLAQPQFAEKAVSIRRVSTNPFLPDEITRVNSISSSLVSQPTGGTRQGSIHPVRDGNGIGDGHSYGSGSSSANASSDILPFGGGRREPHASTSQPRLLGSASIEANSLRSNVIAVGDRRPSVLSGGLADGPDTDKLSIRKISIGGWEAQVQVQAAGIGSSRLPVRTLSPSVYSSTQGHRHAHSRPNQPQPPIPGSSKSDFHSAFSEPLPNIALDQGGTIAVESPVPSPHPFSSTSLRRSSVMAEPTMSFPVPRIRTSQISIPAIAHLPHRDHYHSRPESLCLDGSPRGGPVQSTEQNKDHSYSDARYAPSRQISLALPTGSSTRALKSAPLHSATHGRRQRSDDSSGSVPIPNLERGEPLGSSDEGGMFGDWRGFPPKTSTTETYSYHTAREDKDEHNDHSTSIPEIGLTVSPATPDQPQPQIQSKPRAPAQALARLDGSQQQRPTGTVLTGGLAGGDEGLTADRTRTGAASDSPSPDDKRLSSSSKTSRITYLADVVKEEEEQKRLSLISPFASSCAGSADHNKPPAPSPLPEAHIAVGRQRGQLLGGGSNARLPSLSPLRMEQGLGLNFALAPGIGMGIALGLGAGAETRGSRRQSEGDADGMPRVL